jgi:hypothetical protein
MRLSRQFQIQQGLGNVHLREDVMHDMVLNDAVEDVAANEAKFTVNSRKGTLDESPLVCLVVRRLGMSVVQVGNGNYSEC